ncbi:MAG: hypothetical protein MH112_06545 [Phenylobacterium sp.]|uniref:hypothetical protein n=1 Tax=Phenylobacterium sp. TaxID=1871053 RepID=UPI0025E5F780|nr:hypothetical protein [Phenylobacterium sp.]MCG9916005.1 hypothetical protein [Phenylobacterium sp.]
MPQPVADPELSAAYAALDRADAQVWRHGQDNRPWGVAWSGLGPEPPRRRTPDQLHALARDRLTSARAWTQSPEGQLKTALIDLQTAARALDHQAEALREAASRGLGPQDARRLTGLSQNARAVLAALRKVRSLLV